MGYIEFDERELSNLNEVAEKLLKNIGENDPTSIYYERKLVRQKINWLYLLLSIIILIIFIMIFFIGMINSEKSVTLILFVLLLELTIYSMIFLKKGLIGLIHIYQYFAPNSIRMKCRFEPSCSEYMIISIEKYGIIKGVIKGTGRLKRCNKNNGGYDFP